MSAFVPGEVTQLLEAWRGGDQESRNRLIGILYAQLRAVAHRSRGRQAGLHTLQTTGLIHEAFLKLAESGGIAPRDRAHFLALCAQVMRGILVDEARARMSLKRGGGAPRVELDGDACAANLAPAGIVRLHDALAALSKLDPRKSKVIELRFFGGLTFEEAAEALGISRETALRDWRFGRAWLRSEMNAEAHDA